MQSPKDVIKKSYLKQKPTEIEFKNFKTSLAYLQSSTDEEETEEFNKGLLKDFLNDVGYAKNYKINTYDKVDLAIYKNNKVEVLIECKRLKNKSEMVRHNDLNKKAFHESLLYYMREKIREKNYNVRNIIITNNIEWFIFDATEINKVATNKKIERLYIDFEIDKTLFSDLNPEFYRILGILLDDENLLENIKFTRFNLKDRHTDTQLKYIYKLLSPTHLLKLNSAGDANSLNQNFYYELLYILGLEESKGKSKKLIKRKVIQDREEGSLLENTILKLQTDCGVSDENLLFDIALELNITWLNRILFLKLLEARLLTIHNGDYPKFLAYDVVVNFDNLNTLFFEVLAKKIDERKSIKIEEFKNIPYLNSSLFEPTELEQKYLMISNLKSNLVLHKSTGTILKEEKKELVSVEYLLKFLNAYDFGSNDKDEFKNEHDKLINSSVLGLIFEKLNGYKDGSFFTPSFVTMYMSRESIRKIVVSKFNAHYSWDCKTLTDVYNKNPDLKEANKIINSITVCDPAVGSGHFLVSCLNEFLVIKSELEILADERGKRLRNVSLAIEDDELYITDEEGLFFEYKLNTDFAVSSEVKRIQKVIFDEKIYIIENQLFGVDININSVKITQLRLWIELLKESYYDENNELVTLPNIDINIKNGNSLINKFPLKDTKQNSKASLEKIDSYKSYVKAYKETKDKALKKKIVSEIEELKKTFSIKLKEESPEIVEFKKLINGWKIKNKRTKGYVDKFGFKGLEKALVLRYTDETNLILYTKLGKDYDPVNTSLFGDEIKLTAKEKRAHKQKQEKELKKIVSKYKKIKVDEDNKIYEDSFEWRFEFPEILNNEGNFVGFDVVIGNPPYGVKLSSQQKKYFQNSYFSAKTENGLRGSTDTYSLFVERGLEILNNGILHYIVPLAITSSESMAKLHNMIYRTCEDVKISSYSSRPKKIFAEADQRVSIIELFKNSKPTKHLMTTKINKRYAETPAQDIINNLEFANAINFTKLGRIPKIGTAIEEKILTKLFALPKTLKDYYVVDGKKIYYRTSGGRYYNIITNFSTGSTKEKAIVVQGNYRDIVGAILSSNLYFWFYSIYSNNLDLKSYELEEFPLHLENFSQEDIDNISSIYNRYMEDLEKNAKVVKASYATIDSFKEYRARLSKPLIDAIDRVIYQGFGLNEEECEFLINYDLMFRIDG